ncbi:3'-5' exonuclease [Flavobacterium gilvum]|uniref:Exonuclease n=1 Tax=Flavobacterium gilvum TaxID=1492737 RepID=A0AAC9I7P5_9FLAO|nr:3'-5' exonuclease [Flavobacterium gilvum]AOW11400.1 exonuclease [Flavobacterium gilvum]KFC61145.1 exonuclease [Flavobacterium gilvum]
MTNTFTAIDFETATGYRNSICQIGLVRIENGIIVKEANILVQPPDNYYWSRFTDIHGISSNNTANAPAFDQVWYQIVPYIENQNVVAHNGFGFDFPVLDKTLNHYNLPIPDYNKFCTYKIYRSNLANLCREHNISLNHHNALSDARACGELFFRYLKKLKII